MAHRTHRPSIAMDGPMDGWVRFSPDGPSRPIAGFQAALTRSLQNKRFLLYFATKNILTGVRDVAGLSMLSFSLLFVVSVAV
jgi:hypothetical protein